ncbi:c-type cytochrome [Phenylobacterium sp.]|uniref:c-type cytochrome n=1 Tax=Phenylobacterium sp. TaxID=1871053 RepID=UPI0025EC09BD|nr:c-type cytochrome [Phenylobacterium sp.]
MRRASFTRLAPLALLLASLTLSLSACGPHREAQVERGAQLARALGCADCHGADFTGHKVSHNDQIAILYSSNLTRALPRYSDAAFRTVLTTGARPDGSRLWYMDAAPYAVLSDADLRDLLAFLRTLAPTGADHPRIRTTPAFDELVRTGALTPESATLATDLANPPQPTTPPNERGRYLARTYCAGCHAPSLRGFTPPQPGDPPDLAAVAAYSRDDFRALMSKGQGLAGHDIGEMAEAARKRFSQLPVQDVDALHDYLTRWAHTRRD